MKLDQCHFMQPYLLNNDDISNSQVLGGLTTTYCASFISYKGLLTCPRCWATKSTICVNPWSNSFSGWVYFIPPHHHLIFRLEKVSSKTRHHQTHPRAKGVGQKTTTTRSDILRTRTRILAQRNLNWTIQRSREVHKRSRSSQGISKTCKHIWPSWVKETTSLMTMGSRNHPETRCARHHRLQVVPSTT